MQTTYNKMTTNQILMAIKIFYSYTNQQLGLSDESSDTMRHFMLRNHKYNIY